MSTLTPELNLIKAQDADDTEGYLTNDLAGSLTTVDGLFNSGTGHTHNGSHQGGIITAVGPGAITSAMIADGAIQTVDIADGAVTAAKLAAGILETLFAGTSAIVPGATYTVAPGIMYVFCQAACTVTFPAITTNRPIEVWALNGQVTLAGGTFVGGSINLATGAVTNGVITTGDAISYKSDGSSWRAG